jgi:transcriptional regulator with XRE-family HTH domain
MHTVDLSEALGGRIKEARLARNWSQQELADRIRVSQPTIVHWEQGTHAPRHLALSRLSDTLGVSRAWLTGADLITTEPSRSQSAPTRVLELHESAPARDYFDRPLRHVGVHPWPKDAQTLRAIENRATPPVDYLPFARQAAAPVAFECDDDAMGTRFGPGCILVVDLGARALADGAFFVFEHEGAIVARRWRDVPARLEADTLDRTIFVDTPPVPVGRVLAAIHHF